MVGYSEVLQTMAAMIIFSVILLNANRMIHRNTIMQVEGELEQEVIAVAQDFIEEGRTKDYDEITIGLTAPPADIPGDFTGSASLGHVQDGEANREDFDDFDDYHNYTEPVETEHGIFNIRAEVFYLDPTTLDSTGNRSTFKKMRVYITNEYLRNNSGEKVLYKLEFIRNYYAD